MTIERLLTREVADQLRLLAYRKENMMSVTVGELIEQLKMLNPNTQVYVAKKKKGADPVLSVHPRSQGVFLKTTTELTDAEVAEYFAAQGG